MFKLYTHNEIYMCNIQFSNSQLLRIALPLVISYFPNIYLTLLSQANVISCNLKKVHTDIRVKSHESTASSPHRCTFVLLTFGWPTLLAKANKQFIQLFRTTQLLRAGPK